MKLQKIIILFLSATLFLSGCAGNRSRVSDEDRAYFKHKCDTQAGEFIYKTVENVEGVYQMRPRDPKDYFQRMAKGDIPEDPWGHTNTDAQSPWAPFMREYQYFETPKIREKRRSKNMKNWIFDFNPALKEKGIWRYRLGEPLEGEYYYKRKDGKGYRPLIGHRVSDIKSHYGYTWREVRTAEDIKRGVWGGELIVKDLKTDETLAVKRGFFAFGIQICPPNKMHRMAYDFVKKVLKPAPFKQKGE